MTLKEACANYIAAQGYTGRLFYGEQTIASEHEHIIVRDAGAHNNDPARYFKFPVIEILIRQKTQQGCDALAASLAAAFDAGGPLALTSGYRVARADVPNPPESEGKDGDGIWSRSFSINFLTHFAAAI